MKFEPKTEEEVQIAGLLEPGTYAAEVVKAEAKVSKSGNDMIALTLRVFDGKGEKRLVYDWLLDKVEYKLRHFSASAGLLDRYQDGELSPGECEGKSVSVVLSIQPAKGEYSAKNNVKDYVVNADPKPMEKDDDLPF